eukprot:919377-Rhodomonas_salina.3
MSGCVVPLDAVPSSDCESGAGCPTRGPFRARTHNLRTLWARNVGLSAFDFTALSATSRTRD